MKKLLAILCVLLLAGCAQPAPVPAEPTVKVEPVAESVIEKEVVQIEEEVKETEEIIKEEEPEIEEAVEEVEKAIITGPSGSTPVTLKDGMFETVKYKTSGTVRIDRLPEGNIVVNFIGFDTTPGAGLRVYLYKNYIKQGIDLGVLTSVSGNYPYDIPAGVNINAFDKVAIYSISSEEIYGEAKLS